MTVLDTLMVSILLIFHVIPQKDLEEWRLVFWITFGIFVITTVAYTLWASGEIQPWNDPFVQQKTIEISEQNDTSDWGFAAVKYEDEQNK